MRIFSKLTGGIAAVALIAVSTAPASARGWNSGWGGHRHHDRGASAGEVIGAIAAVGIIAAIASSASKKNKEVVVERRYDTPPPSTYDDDDAYYDNGAPRPRYDDGTRYDSRSPDRYDDGRSFLSEQDEAVDGCVLAARDKASGGRGYAEVQGVTGVQARGNGWDVTGQVEQRSTFRANDGWSRNFRCTWQDGRVSAVTLD